MTMVSVGTMGGSVVVGFALRGVGLINFWRGGVGAFAFEAKGLRVGVLRRDVFMCRRRWRSHP